METTCKIFFHETQKLSPENLLSLFDGHEEFKKKVILPDEELLVGYVCEVPLKKAVI